ncbi:outer membrane beta-barrel protein [uncultured Bacteroides sp.]|uniref:TonB-dependent receptor n=1 Tax=uncultured Bacteroides sp. TaxID=162156 RepID=UPI002AA7697A|nr:outer membrane beta-barrel protein [uncultured Bacteroides sp.]
MRKIVHCFIIMAYATTLYAQNYTIKGRVIDQNKQAISYASIALLASDSTALVTGTISDDKGEFRLPGINRGKYYISLSFVGYKPIKEFVLLNSNIDRTFVLADDAVALNEIVVKANRSNIIKQSAAGQTFMLSESALKKKDVLDALQEVPSLAIDPGTRKITLNDGSNPLILVNGIRREGGLSAINPEDILSVEVIPTSSAEFLREGYTSVVNIKVRKADRSYTSFNGGINSNPLLQFGITDASLEFGNSKSSFYLSGQTFTFLNNKSDMLESSRTSESSREVRYKRKGDYTDTNWAMGGDRNWSASDYTSFGLTFDYIPQNNNADGETEIRDLTADRTTRYDYTRDYDDKSWTGTANLYHRHTFSASTLDFLFQLNRSKNENKVNQLESGATNLVYDYDFRNHHTGMAFTPAYQFAFSNFKVKTGINNYYQYNKIYQNEGVRSEFTHKEWNEYPYLDINGLWKHFSLAVSAGVDAVFRSINDYSDHYFRLRPVVNLNYKFNTHQAITLNYSMQSTSPDVVQLNPYNTSSDTLSIITGNPSLRPFRTNQVRFSYSLSKGPFFVEPAVRYKKITNSIVTVGEDSPEGYIQSLANAGTCEVWSGMLTFRYTIGKYGFIGGNMEYSRQRFPDISQSDNFLNGRINWGLNCKKFNLSGFYGLPRYSYDMYKHTKSSPESWCTLSFAASESLNVSVGMRYIGNHSHVQRWVDMPDYSSYYDNRFTNRGNTIMLGIRYKFQSRKQSRSIEKLQNNDKGFRVISE